MYQLRGCIRKVSRIDSFKCHHEILLAFSKGAYFIASMESLMPTIINDMLIHKETTQHSHKSVRTTSNGPNCTNLKHK